MASLSQCKHCRHVFLPTVRKKGDENATNEKYWPRKSVCIMNSPGYADYCFASRSTNGRRGKDIEPYHAVSAPPKQTWPSFADQTSVGILSHHLCLAVVGEGIPASVPYSFQGFAVQQLDSGVDTVQKYICSGRFVVDTV